MRRSCIDSVDLWPMSDADDTAHFVNGVASRHTERSFVFVFGMRRIMDSDHETALHTLDPIDLAIAPEIATTGGHVTTDSVVNSRVTSEAEQFIRLKTMYIIFANIKPPATTVETNGGAVAERNQIVGLAEYLEALIVGHAVATVFNE